MFDGFGNELTPDELVENFWKYSHFMAGQMVNASSTLYDDLVQEALIEVWQVGLKKPDGVPATYMTKALKYKMVNIKQGKPMVGGDSTPGPKSRPAELVVDWQDVSAGENDYGFEHLLEAADILAAVDLAYHRGEIMEALNSLPERDRLYVHKKFWEGKTDTEIAAETDGDNKSIGNRWKRIIRPAMAARLAHLIDA